MQVIETALPGVLIIESRVFEDNRGFFFESYHEKRYWDAGLQVKFVQDNHSFSKKGTLRGLHYQLKNPQGKLVRIASGEVFDVAADIRQGSPTFGQWVGVILSAENKKQIYVPPGFAHGFCVLSETADFLYKCTDFYMLGDEYAVRWNDPDLDIDWKMDNPALSAKDEVAPFLKDAVQFLPVYEG